MGSCDCSSWAIASFACASARSLSGAALYAGAYPAFNMAAFRTTSGAFSSCSHAISSSRLGLARPLSTKLMCRCETPTRSDNVCWLRRVAFRACRRMSGRESTEVSTPELNGTAAPIQ